MTDLPSYAHWDSTGTFKVTVAGTSHYRGEIAAIALNPNNVSALVICLAYLVPDSQNIHDSNAIRVVIEGQTVGYLASDYAKIYRSFSHQLPSHIKHISVAAAITNGMMTKDKTYEYTVELDIPESLKLHPLSKHMDYEVTRVNGYVPLQKESDGIYFAPVWVPTPDFDELNKSRIVKEWTSESWNSIGYFAMNSQGIGRGFKVYELSKSQYKKLFKNGPTKGQLLLDSGRFAKLRIQTLSASG